MQKAVKKKKKRQISNIQKARNIVAEWTVLALNDPTENLDISYLGLAELPPIPSNCRSLTCVFNKLTSLPQLNYHYLSCGGNQLTSLPELPDCWFLTCSDNKLISLPPLPKCQQLYCGNNKLTFLPELPYCDTLDCSHNMLTTLPEQLHNECEVLDCSDNQLTSLSHLWRCKIDCRQNNLTYLANLTDCHMTDCTDYKYLYVSKKQAKRLFLKETPNYNKYARVIQRTYKKYLRNRYQQLLNNHLFPGLSKLVSLYSI